MKQLENAATAMFVTETPPTPAMALVEPPQLSKVVPPTFTTFVGYTMDRLPLVNAAPASSEIEMPSEALPPTAIEPGDTKRLTVGVARASWLASRSTAAEASRAM